MFSQLGIAMVQARTLPAGRIHLDQQQRHFSRGLSVRYSAVQSIKAGHTGAVVRVDVPLCTPIRGSVVGMTVFTRNERARSSLRFGHSYSDCLWSRFTFARPIRVRTDQVFSVSLKSLSGEAPLWAASGAQSNGDPYPRGSGSWAGHVVNDFAFRVYLR
ncbi:MAG: hypothetical protein ACR2JC_11225 [Chloroflexota bacterium]|nr:MAG: hypothetical protein DLM70_02995 [Chloroflexota bacterium]